MKNSENKIAIPDGQVVAIYKDWENEFELMGWGVILEIIESDKKIIPQYRGTDKWGNRKENKAGWTATIQKIKIVPTELTSLGETEYQIGVPKIRYRIQYDNLVPKKLKINPNKHLKFEYIDNLITLE